MEELKKDAVIVMVITTGCNGEVADLKTQLLTSIAIRKRVYGCFCHFGGYVGRDIRNQGRVQRKVREELILLKLMKL
ncbi:hypothetical protein [Borrelia hispanica]|uniref:hypothetical protein n=1 Tax=Borrelia hispanica TaxID=40835 RepID=UPI0004670768|nr:hypothetical protein [Borrelia hispanica]